MIMIQKHFLFATLQETDLHDVIDVMAKNDKGVGEVPSKSIANLQ